MQNEATPVDADGAAVERRVDAAHQMLRSGRWQEAAAASDALLRDHASSASVLGLGADVRLAQDEAEAALELISKAVRIAPTSVELAMRHAQVLMALMRRDAARDVADQIASAHPGDARALWSAGRIHARCDAPDRAVQCYEQALSAGIDDPGLLYDLASSYFFLGDFAAAERHLDALLLRKPTSGDALYLRSTLRRQQPSENHVADLEQRFRSGIGNPVDAAGCLYALAKEHEDLGNWDKSFSALTGGARAKRASLNYDAAAEREAMEQIAHAFTREVIAGGPAGHPERGAIFIVGMPRTGTTLVERILGRHASVASAGELPYFAGGLATAARRAMQPGGSGSMVEAALGIDFAALGRTYMEGARRAAPPAAMFVDKMPVNFMYCGLIRKALPEAKIIHLVRDPMDTCYAVYKTLFQKAYFFSNDLDELADYYATYRRLMAHWHQVMPGQILDVRYEDLVSDTEAQARRMLTWCGLDWQPEVLAPHADKRPATTASAAQVREPVHSSSVGKWRRYATGLEPLKRRLQASGVLEA